MAEAHIFPSAFYQSGKLLLGPLVFQLVWFFRQTDLTGSAAHVSFKT
jgi:hypothetical protein